MNRNQGRPKVMNPCDCASRYQSCNCEWIRLTKPPYPGYVHIPLVVLGICAAIVAGWYLIWLR